jgi:Flp pilus assembly protein TadD
VGVFVARRRWPALGAVWSSYLVILAPNLGLVRIGQQIAADRYSYVAMTGMVVLVAAGMCEIWQAVQRLRPVAVGLTTALLAVLVGLILLSRDQCRTWRTAEILWTRVVTHGGIGSSLAHDNLGVALFKQGHVDEACTHYREALRLDPNQVGAHNNLGIALFMQGHVDEACTHYREALRLDPNNVEAHMALDLALLKQGRIAECVPHYTEASRANPDRTDVRKNLGQALSRQGRLAEAMAQYAEAVRLDPTDSKARTNLGAILLLQGRLQEAMTQYAETARLEPSNVEALNNRAAIWASAPDAKLRDGHRAVEAANRANELTGWKDPAILDTYAAAHAEAGDFENAVKWETKAIDLLTDEKRKEDFRFRLRLYQSGKPYRMVIERR